MPDRDEIGVMKSESAVAVVVVVVAVVVGQVFASTDCPLLVYCC